MPAEYPPKRTTQHPSLGSANRCSEPSALLAANFQALKSTIGPAFGTTKRGAIVTACCQAYISAFWTALRETKRATFAPTDRSSERTALATADGAAIRASVVPA